MVLHGRKVLWLRFTKCNNSTLRMTGLTELFTYRQIIMFCLETGKAQIPVSQLFQTKSHIECCDGIQCSQIVTNLKHQDILTETLSITEFDATYFSGCWQNFCEWKMFRQNLFLLKTH